MPRAEKWQLHRMVRPLRLLVAVAVVLLAIGLALYAVNQRWGQPGTDRELEESARENVARLIGEVDGSMTDGEIANAARRRQVFPRQIRREPNVITVLAMAEGSATGVPYGIRKELCFRIELHLEPNDTVVRREKQCPPLAPSLRPTPSAPSTSATTR